MKNKKKVTIEILNPVDTNSLTGKAAKGMAESWLSDPKRKKAMEQQAINMIKNVLKRK